MAETTTLERPQLALFEGYEISVFAISLSGGAQWRIIDGADRSLQDAFKVEGTVTITVTAESGETVSFDGRVASKKHGVKKIDEVRRMVESVAISVDDVTPGN